MQAAGNTTGAEFSDLRNYVMSRLLWDPTQSARALQDEFLDLHYGPAAPPIRRFIEMEHEMAENSSAHRNCFGRAKDYGFDESITVAAFRAFGEAGGARSRRRDPRQSGEGVARRPPPRGRAAFGTHVLDVRNARRGAWDGR